MYIGAADREGKSGEVVGGQGELIFNNEHRQHQQSHKSSVKLGAITGNIRERYYDNRYIR